MNVASLVAAVIAVLSVIGNAAQWLLTRRDRIAKEHLDVTAADATGRHDVRKAELAVVPSLLSRIEALETREATQAAQLMAAREALAHATEALNQEREVCAKDREECRAALGELHLQLADTKLMLDAIQQHSIAYAEWSEQVLDLIEAERSARHAKPIERPTPPEFPAVFPRRPSSDPPEGSGSD